tara:strand:- start:2948 stop:3709 length:762 start_codon:yes stop_codon:yes gene_type:complete
MFGIPKTDFLKILSVFVRRIGLLFLFVIALYFDGTHFASIFPDAQLLTNAFMFLAFGILYYRSVKRTRELMIYGVLIGFAGEYLFSIVLDMYTYRLGNLPWYIPFGHGAVYARTHMFAKASITRKYAKQINTLFYIIISIFALIYLIAFHDIFGFIMTLGVFGMLVIRPKDRLFFLTMYVVVAVLEIGGTAYSTWSWPSTAFGVFDFLPSNNPPSGISLFYFLLDVSCFMIYIIINRKTWKRFKSIKRLQKPN